MAVVDSRLLTCALCFHKTKLLARNQMIFFLNILFAVLLYLIFLQ